MNDNYFNMLLDDDNILHENICYETPFLRIKLLVTCKVLKRKILMLSFAHV